jgi:hypothetical protein
MNEDMRSGTIIKALISSCNAFPEIILDVISSSLVLWPVSIYSAKDKNWRIPKSEPVFRVGDINSLGQLSNDDEVSIKGHLMAKAMILPIPDMASLSFLSAITTDGDVNIFASKYLGVMLRTLWDEEIKWIFIVDFLFYTIFCVCWTALVVTVI